MHLSKVVQLTNILYRFNRLHLTQKAELQKKKKKDGNLFCDLKSNLISQVFGSCSQAEWLGRGRIIVTWRQGKTKLSWVWHFSDEVPREKKEQLFKEKEKCSFDNNCVGTGSLPTLRSEMERVSNNQKKGVWMCVSM